MKYVEALEILYRKDCCVQSPNPSCGNCKLGDNGNCKIYACYMMFYVVTKKLDPTKVKQKIDNIGHCPNCSCSVNISYHGYCPECGQALDWS